MLATKTWGCTIIRQRFYRRYDTLRILKAIVAGLIGAVILYAIVAIIYNIPYDVIPPILIGLGVILFFFSIFSNIKKNSPPKIGTVTQGEFFSVIAVLIGIMLGIYGRIDSVNGRIDDIYQILLTMK